jgi:hypothetical protein
MVSQTQSLFPDAEEVASLDEQIASVKREIKLRENAYPKWIESGRMKQEVANREIRAMKSVLFTLEAAARERNNRIKIDVPSDDWRIVEVRDYLRRNAAKGVQCPSCKQNVQIQTYSFTRSCARNLLAIYRATMQGGQYVSVDGWIDVPALLKSQGMARGNDSAMLAWYGLTEARDGIQARTGIYRLTDHGKRFVQGEVRIRKFVRRYNAKSLRCDDETTITLAEALNEPFDLQTFLNQTSTGESINLADEQEVAAHG